MATLTIPIIKFSTTSRFLAVWNDRGSGAARDGAFYRPIPEAGFFILGDYGQGNYHEPSGTVLTIRVENDDPARPALVPPEDYALIWKDKGSGANEDGSFWAPKPPFGYVACGHVIQHGWDKPTNNNSPGLDKLRCLRHDLAVEVDLGGLIWNDQGSGADADVSIYRIPRLDDLFAVPSYSPPSERAYIPRLLD